MTIDIRITTLDPVQYGPEDMQLEKALATIGFVRKQAVEKEAFDAGFEAGAGYPNATIVGDTEVASGQAPAPAAPKRTRKSKKDEPAPATETAPAKTAPAPQQVAEDPPEVAAQDAADEAAETAANKTDAAPTLDDIRNVLGLYQKVYGLPATMTDGPLILQEVCGEGVNKVSSVPEDKIADVIAALKKAGNENRFGRQQVAS